MHIPVETLQHWIDLYGYAGLFFALVFGIVGLPVPDESLLTLSGYLVSAGRFQFIPTFCVAALGSLTGITSSYWIGRAGGYRLIHKYGPRIHLTEERLLAVNRWFDRIGKWTLTVGYFIPGVRHFTALVAGASQLRYPVFAAFAYSGGVIWTLTFISLGYSLGETWSQNFHWSYRVPLTIAAIVVFIVIALVWHFKRKKSQS
jgi:membrane protein DedA with SNARE-associated domain